MLATAAATVAWTLWTTPALAAGGAEYGRLGAPEWVWIASAGITAGAVAVGGAIGWWFHRKRRAGR